MELACILIVEGKRYKLIGPDEGLKRWLDNVLKSQDNSLEYSETESDDSMGIHYEVGHMVDFSDPDFPYAFYSTIREYTLINSEGYYYTGSIPANKDNKKVNSEGDVQRLVNANNKLLAMLKKEREEKKA